MSNHKIFKTRGGSWSAMVDGREAAFIVVLTEIGTFDVYSFDENNDGDSMLIAANKMKQDAEIAMDEYERRAAR